MILYFHIGTEKTATTTLQYFLLKNKDALEGLGYYFPTEKGSNHTYLATYAAENFDKVNDLLIYQNIKTQTTQTEYRNTIEEYFNNFTNKTVFDKNILLFFKKKYLKGNSNKTKEFNSNLILSNEHCSTRLKTKQEIQRLKKLFDNVGFKTKIVVYLRRQDEYLISLYSTYILHGGTHKLSEFIKNKEIRFRFNYQIMLQFWVSVFGRENIIVRIFEKETLSNNNIMYDFLNSIGIKDHSEFIIPSDQNKSMDAKSLEFLRNLNFHMPHFVNNKINSQRAAIIELLKQLPFTEKVATNNIPLKAFYESFTESNNGIAKEFFNTDTLFKEKDTKPVLSDENLEEEIDNSHYFYLFSELWKLNRK